MPILMEKEEEGMLSPILAHGGVRFMWIKHNNLYRIPLSGGVGEMAPVWATESCCPQGWLAQASGGPPGTALSFGTPCCLRMTSVIEIQGARTGSLGREHPRGDLQEGQVSATGGGGWQAGGVRGTEAWAVRWGWDTEKERTSFPLCPDLRALCAQAHGEAWLSQFPSRRSDRPSRGFGQPP